MEARGGTPTFAIVAAGAGGAEPHHLSDDTVLKEGDVVILDFGCAFGGYQSDITRTIAVGTASEEAKRVLPDRAHRPPRRSETPPVRA